MRGILIGLVLVLALPAAAAAKGPSSASVSGPGIDRLAIAGYGEGGPGSPLGALVQYGGFFPQMFGGAMNGRATTQAPPTDALGPRYTVTYVVPGGNEDSVLRQQLYPYARGGPVTYMQPDVRFWGTQRTAGGWYRADAGLKRALVDAGLPAKAPAAGGTHIWRWTGVGLGAVAAAAVLLLLLRRRPRPEPAHA